MTGTRGSYRLSGRMRKIRRFVDKLVYLCIYIESEKERGQRNAIGI